MLKNIGQSFLILIFIPFFVNAYDVSLNKLTIEEKISWGILGVTVLVCFFVLGKIFFVNILQIRKKRMSRKFVAIEKLYNTGAVLVFSYAEVWYRYAKRTESQVFETHGEMRDMRATASGQVVSYLLGRNYTSQDQIKDIEVRSRATVTRSYVPLWADEIMGRELIFKAMVLQLLVYGDYLSDIEKKKNQKFSEGFDFGTDDRRRQMLKKYGNEDGVAMDKKRYKELVDIFSEWADNFLKLSDAEKISRAEKNSLFLGNKE